MTLTFLLSLLTVDGIDDIFGVITAIFAVTDDSFGVRWPLLCQTLLLWFRDYFILVSDDRFCLRDAFQVSEMMVLPLHKNN